MSNGEPGLPKDKNVAYAIECDLTRVKVGDFDDWYDTARAIMGAMTA
jgi:hypothetical protein